VLDTAMRKQIQITKLDMPEITVNGQTDNTTEIRTGMYISTSQ